MSNDKTITATRALIAAYGRAIKNQIRLREEYATAQAATAKALKKALPAFRRTRPDLSEEKAEFVLQCVAEDLANEVGK
jgi:DNA-binding transcriptional MocR family regulator